MIQYFLYRDPHRCPPAPYADDKAGGEPAFKNANAELEGIIQQILCAQVYFFVHAKIRCCDNDRVARKGKFRLAISNVNDNVAP